jgi:hypothetical protein
MHTDTQEDHDGMAEKEAEKDRHRFPHAAQVEHQKQRHHGDLDAELQVLNVAREKAEHRIDAARDRNRNGQHIVDDQRRAGDQTGVGTDQVGGDRICSAPTDTRLSACNGELTSVTRKALRKPPSLRRERSKLDINRRNEPTVPWVGPRWPSRSDIWRKMGPSPNRKENRDLVHAERAFDTHDRN